MGKTAIFTRNPAAIRIKTSLSKVPTDIPRPGTRAVVTNPAIAEVALKGAAINIGITAVRIGLEESGACGCDVQGMYSSADNWKRLRQSGYMGFIGGTVFGGALSPTVRGWGTIGAGGTGIGLSSYGLYRSAEDIAENGVNACNILDVTVQAGVLALSSYTLQSGVEAIQLQSASMQSSIQSGRQLYRGLSRDHPQLRIYEETGVIKPRGGNSTLQQHVLGDTRSNYTSWTLDPAVARDFAGPDGVVLTINESQLTNILQNSYEWSPFQLEWEVSILGPVFGALPLK